MSTSNKFRVAWRDIDWAKTHRRVRRAQRRIYKAAYDDRKGLVRELQYRLITSLDAKHAAVSTVTTYRGRSTAGVDGVKRINAKQKMKLAKSLRLDGQAQPVRRGTKPKPGGGERRPNGIQTIRDRAKQALAKLALEPEWEARFEPNAYGFRPGRCAHDAIEAIRLKPARLHVIRAGREIASAPPAMSSLALEGRPASVDVSSVRPDRP